MSHPELPPGGGTSSNHGDDSAGAPANGPLVPRALLVSIIALTLAVMAVLVLLRFLVAEKIPDLTAAQLESARQLWDKRGPPGYDLDLEIRGMQPGTVHVEVRNRTVAAETRDNRAIPERTWDFWTVPGLFDMLDRELEMAEDPQHESKAASGTTSRLRCEFDDQFGFPRRFHRRSTGDTPELDWRVTRFERK